MTHQWAGQPQNVNIVVGVDGYGNPVEVSSSNALPVSLPGATALSDAFTNPTVPVYGAFNSVFNGTSWDRMRGGLVGAAGPSGMANMLVEGVYQATAPILTSGQVVTEQMDVNGNIKGVEQYAPAYENNVDGIAYVLSRALATASGAWSLTSSGSAGVGTSGVSIKTSAGRIRSVHVSNANATTGFWLQIFNKASAAVNNDVPVARIFVPSQTIAGQGSGGSQVIEFGSEGLYLGTGIALAASSTIGLLTLIAATDCHYTCKWL